MKKFLCTLMCMLLVVCFMPYVPWTETAQADIEWGTDCVAQLSRDGTQVGQYATIASATDAWNEAETAGEYVITIKDNTDAYNAGDLVV